MCAQVLDEEIESRLHIFSTGVRDISTKVKLPPNSFESIDTLASEYDDLRGCHICKHICVFSAVACECDKAKVACVRHFAVGCQCAKDRKYMLEWASTDDLKALRRQLRETMAEAAKNPMVSSPRSLPPPPSLTASASSSHS